MTLGSTEGNDCDLRVQVLGPKQLISGPLAVTLKAVPVTGQNLSSADSAWLGHCTRQKKRPPSWTGCEC